MKNWDDDIAHISVIQNDNKVEGTQEGRQNVMKHESSELQ